MDVEHVDRLRIDALDLDVDERPAEIVGEAHLPVRAVAGGLRAARLCDGVLERNCLGVVAGVFSSSSPSWCGVKKAS
ncbi:hypothetical protein [Nannocystis pusilla]|uniref:hypothetical protein n=1 Tax=Nannocystis pusilla TaxID=889268 RepID=UPI003B7E74BD